MPKEVRTDEIGNPTDLIAYRAPLDSDWATILNVQGPSVVLVKHIKDQEYEIMRRIPWPASQWQFDALQATYEGDGTGTGGGVFAYTEAELPPIPKAIRDFFGAIKNLGVAALVAAIVITITNEEK